CSSDLAALTALFRQERMIGVMFADGLDDLPLREHVDLGDEIVLALRAHIQSMRSIHAANDDFSSPPCGANGDVQQRLHAYRSSDNACGKGLKSSRECGRRRVEYQHVRRSRPFTASCPLESFSSTHSTLVTSGRVRAQ